MRKCSTQGSGSSTESSPYPMRASASMSTIPSAWRYWPAGSRPTCPRCSMSGQNSSWTAQAGGPDGLRIPFGGTNTHLTNVDCSPIIGPDGTTLSGDMAARILDLVGIVVNRNTIPGDTTAARPSGIRLGTVWITQRGFGEAESERLGQWIAQLLLACRPFSYKGLKGPMGRARVDFDVLSRVQLEVRDLASGLGIDCSGATICLGTTSFTAVRTECLGPSDACVVVLESDSELVRWQLEVRRSSADFDAVSLPAE